MKRGTTLVATIWAGAIVALTCGRAHAEPACGTDNLLAGRKPARTDSIRGDVALLTDGAIGAEGTVWDAPVAVVLESPSSAVTFDLGEARSVSALYVQADANDTYKISGALEDKPSSYKVLAELPNVVTERGHGLRGRTVTVPATTVRYLRVGDGNGDGYFSLSEIAAFCKAPAPFPPAFRVVAAPPAAANNAAPAAKTGDSGGGSIVLLVIAALGLAWLAYRTVKGVPEESSAASASAATSTPPATGAAAGPDTSSAGESGAREGSPATGQPPGSGGSKPPSGKTES